METHYIELVLAEKRDSIERPAKRLGISRSSLYSKVKLKAIERPTIGRDTMLTD
jgi:transcriptional regulator with PAS, ATPase and Fis domain